MDNPTITHRQASKLANRTWRIGNEELRFSTTMITGGEAFVFPMSDASGNITTYMRFLDARYASPARIERTEWLIRQRWHEVTSALLATPRAWASTYELGRPNGFAYDFVATLHHPVPGVSWSNMKLAMDRDGTRLPPMEIRIEIAKSLIAQLAVLESLGIIHGDPSDTNFHVDPTGAVHFLDFDAFVTKSRNLKFSSLSVENGGVKGTPGYMPPDLEANASQDAAPYSDRFGRDMLLLEILGIRPGDPVDASPIDWHQQEALLKTVRPFAKELGLMYLTDPTVFSAVEDVRPTSKDLAIAVSCRMPTVTLSKPSLNRSTMNELNRWKAMLNDVMPDELVSVYESLAETPEERIVAILFLILIFVLVIFAMLVVIL